MRYTTRIRIKKMVYIAFAILAFAVLNYLLITKVFRTATSIEKSVKLIAEGTDVKVYPYDDGVVVVDGEQVISYDYLGAKQFTSTMPIEGMKAYRKGNFTICWYSNLSSVAVVINSAGELLKKIEFDGEILMATCNSTQFAVAIIEEEQSKIRVFNFDGIEVWDNLYPDMNILSIGYFGEKNVQLWALALDYHGTLPITKLFTNHPGSSQTGRISVNNQVCYDIVPLEDLVYLIGTHHIQSRTYTDKKQSEILINGWALQDSFVNDKNEVSFLLAPVDTTGSNVPLSALWYITPEVEQYRISMPAGIKSAVLTEKRIYAISSEGIYYMLKNGEKRKFSKLTFIIDEVIGVSKGKAITVRSGEKYYIVGLNK